jgi:pyruvate/2-oxoglutarate dehydrogenase complex dihydrolipoamide acyltransferase (E2) component
MSINQVGSVTLVVPTLAEYVTEAAITRWFSGERVDADEPLFEVVIEIPSPAIGFVLDIVVTEDARSRWAPRPWHN